MDDPERPARLVLRQPNPIFALRGIGLIDGDRRQNGSRVCHDRRQPHVARNLSRDWIRISRQKGLPKVSFHALRHSHASALIASGLDVLTVSRRLGHGSPVVTLNTYAHLFAKTDTAAAAAIDRVLK